jgi:hypothetical protein
MKKEETLIHEAEEIEREIDQRLSQGEDGSYLDYLSRKAQHLRILAINAREEG